MLGTEEGFFLSRRIVFSHRKEVEDITDTVGFSACVCVCPSEHWARGEQTVKS